jgi:hypothetical protein
MSQPQDRPEDGLTAFEADLGALSPAPHRLDRDRLMYLAGRSSALGRRATAIRRAWPAIAAGLALVSLGEAALLVTRADPEPRVVERVVYLPAPAPSPSPIGPPEALASTAAEEPADPDPVVILHRSPPPDDRRGVADAKGPIGLSPAWLRRHDYRLGIDALPDPPPLPLALGPIGESPGRSFRSELDALLKPGESS